MRKSIFIFTGICCLMMSACEVEFDIEGLDSEPLFIIDGHVRNEIYAPGTCYLSMYIYGAPSAAGDREFDKDARCTLKVYKNSELVDTKDYITISTFFGLIADSYPDVSPGDEITITAESPGFPTATSRTVIPQTPPEVELSCEVEDKALRIHFSFVDDAETEDAYAVCFRTIPGWNLPDDGQIGGSIDIPFKDSPESSMPGSGPFDVTWEDGSRYYGIFDDTFNGGRKEYDITIPDTGQFSSYGEQNLYLRVELQRISPERLRYEIACRDKASNVLGFIGLSPVTFAYTNVSGGSGVFSSGNVGGSGWVKVFSRK